MDDKKIIINVGRQLGSGGRIIASMLAKDLSLIHISEPTRH